jgi:hypothetical protein
MTQQLSDNQRSRFSMTQPLWRLAFLVFITLGFYQLHWAYMHWRSFDFGRLQSGFFAIFSGFTIYGIAKRIFHLAGSQGVIIGFSPGVILFGYAIGNVISNRAPGFWFILGVPIAIVPLLYVQNVLNLYWEKSRTQHRQIPLFSWGLFAWSVLGLLLWSLAILGTLDEMGLLKNG